jgi:hypothetical protein
MQKRAREPRPVYVGCGLRLARRAPRRIARGARRARPTVTRSERRMCSAARPSSTRGAVSLARRVDVPRARHAIELVLAPVGELHTRAYDELLDVEERPPRPAPRARRREHRWGRPGRQDPVRSPRTRRCGRLPQFDAQLRDALAQWLRLADGLAGPSNADSAPSPMCLTTRLPRSVTIRSTSVSWCSSVCAP